MEITDEMIDAGMAGWHKAIIDAPDEPVPARRRRCIRAALEAALAAPASAAEPVAWDCVAPDGGRYLIRAEGNQEPMSIIDRSSDYYRQWLANKGPEEAVTLAAPASAEPDNLAPLTRCPDREWEAFHEAYEAELDLRPREGNEAMYRALLVAINMHRAALAKKSVTIDIR